MPTFVTPTLLAIDPKAEEEAILGVLERRLPNISCASFCGFFPSISCAKEALFSLRPSLAY